MHSSLTYGRKPRSLSEPKTTAVIEQKQPARVAGIEESIYFIRGQKAMLDSDLARIYGVSTMRLNEQFKRNRGRFPADFAFQLTPPEFANLISQFAISRSHGGRRKLKEQARKYRTSTAA